MHLFTSQNYLPWIFLHITKNDLPFDKHFVIFISDGSIILTFANININLCRENVSIINYANESSLHKYYNDFVLC